MIAGQSGISFATGTSDTSALLSNNKPQLNCAASGELTGNHPGWASAASQKLTRVHLRNASWGVYWCPASAPQGKGQISYTVTATLGAITCETISTACIMVGISEKTSLALMATDETGSYRSTSIAIQNSGTPEPCIKETSICNPAPINISFPTYGNSYANGISNCTFAAVANWEALVLGQSIDPQRITEEFYAAGGTATRGLTTEQVFNYWKGAGVGGVHLADSSLLSTDPLTVKHAIDSPNIRVVIASLDLGKNQNFAGYAMATPVYHWVIVDGYTSQGPEVVSWGRTLQMTWQQWNLEAVSIWRLTTNA